VMDERATPEERAAMRQVWPDGLPPGSLNASFTPRMSDDRTAQARNRHIDKAHREGCVCAFGGECDTAYLLTRVRTLTEGLDEKERSWFEREEALLTRVRTLTEERDVWQRASNALIRVQADRQAAEERLRTLTEERDGARQGCRNRDEWLAISERRLTETRAYANALYDALTNVVDEAQDQKARIEEGRDGPTAEVRVWRMGRMAERALSGQAPEMQAGGQELENEAGDCKAPSVAPTPNGEPTALPLGSTPCAADTAERTLAP
jgi:hypothetical protein